MNEKELYYLNSLKIIDDNFGRIVFQDHACGIEILRILRLVNPNEEILHYETQKDSKTLFFRSIVLDYFVHTKTNMINVEIENSRTNASPKRARFHASHMDVNESHPKVSFRDLKNRIVVFICSFDYFNKGYSHYVFENIDQESNILLNDQSKIIYINGTYKGNDVIGNLVHDLTCSDPKQIKNPILKKRVLELKQTERGKQYMCKVWDEIRNEGIEKGKLISIQAVMKSLNISINKALEILQIPSKDWGYYKQLITTTHGD